MKILARILALFLIVPVVELALLLQVDKLVGFWPTVGLIFFTGILGGFLAKREGLSVWRRLDERLGTGDLPSKELIDGVIILCAGALLITPGVLTDLFGFLGLIPPSRAVIRKLIEKWAEKAMTRKATHAFDFTGWELNDPSMPPNGNDDLWSQDMGPGWAGQAQNTPRHAAEPPDVPPQEG